jgi:hypothetical protein
VEGLDLPNLEAAIKEATGSLSAIAEDVLREGSDRESISIVVRDGDGSPVYTASLSFCGTRL